MSTSTVPPHLRAVLRTEMLKQLGRSASLDDYELQLFEWYLKETESLTGAMVAAESSYLSRQAAAGVEELNDSGMVAANYYLRRVRYSHVIYLASLLETAMKRECDRLISAIGKHNASFSATELKGDPWTARRKILEGYGGFSVPDSLWAPIQQLLTVRNALVHHNGEAAMLTAEQTASLEKIAGITLAGGDLEIDAAYIESALKCLRDLTTYLHIQVQLVIDRAIRPQPLSSV